MNKPYVYIIVAVVVITLILLYVHFRIDELEQKVTNVATPIQVNSYQQNITASINIENVNGNGNAFGDYNTIENKG